MVIHFSLPNFYEFHKINQFLIQTQLKQAYAFIYENNINFYTLKGSIPYNSWNGGLNHNYGDIILSNKVKEIFLFCHGLPLRLDFSNLLLEQRDFYDALGNVILKEGNNGAFFIELSNLDLMEYIMTNYSNYHNFIISNSIFINNPLTIDNYMSLAELENIKLITLPRNTYKDLELLKKIPKKNKIELIVNPLCLCDSYKTCLLQENFNQLHYNEYSLFSRCEHRLDNDNKNLLSLETINQFYLPLGINHFTFDYPSLIQSSVSDILAFYIKYFIKKEYQMEIYQKGVSFILND